MTTSTPALRILAAVAAGAVLVGRPRGVVHVHAGALTRSGRAVPAAVRPYCGVRTRRLRVLATTTGDVTTAIAGHRFCRTCVTLLPARLGGGSGVLVTRDDWAEAYGDLTVADLHLAASWARTVDETYQVMTVLRQHGPKPIRPTTDDGRALAAAYDAVIARRRKLTSAAMTDDERAAVREAREVELFNRQHAEKQRRKNVAIEKAQQRALSGGYVTPGDRELLNSA
ncbi:hypothetical protein [Nocardioides sp. SLBN-35]|uniref:hypothetical protein n=1 Tax=Nocardioides sp. SLBN-35 TaxID=2768445 RepID=UPI00115068D2|nr:hypothetical protein [Nocardioides sp. SLBN-35]TQK68267.1 hypothetical protein FBY23_0013 [Nocardioides sp. SLBN-35]